MRVFAAVLLASAPIAALAQTPMPVFTTPAP